MDERLNKLREDAERKLSKTTHQKTDVPIEDFNRIIHDLKVYQIELELQNEELRRTQQQLQDSRNQFANLYNYSPVGYVTLNRNSLIIQSNQTFAEMINMEVSELLEVRMSEFLCEDEVKVFHGRFNSFFSKPEGKRMEMRMKRKGGRPFWVRFTGRKINGMSDGTKESQLEPHLFLIISDISQEKKFEKELIETENNYRTLANSGQALIWASGKDKNCVYFNDVWLKFTGRPIEMEVGSGWLSGVHPDDRQQCMDTYISAFDKRETFSMDYRLLRHDDQYRWLRDDGSPRYNTDGEFMGYIGHCLDITDSKMAELDLAASEQKFRNLSKEFESILDHLPILVYYKDRKNNFLRVNKFMSDSYRRKKEELEGANLADLHTLEEAERYLKDDLEVIDSGVPKMNIEEMWNTPEGMKWVNTSKIPFLNENGHITGVIGISMDITDRKQAEVKLESLNRELHTLNATKDKFFSIIAHDLKSPFNSIIGLSEILVDQVNDRDYKGIDKFAKIIYQSSNRAMDLLTNLMEWSQAQTGRMAFMPDRFALSPLVEDVVVAFEIICRQKEVSLQTKLDSDIHVFADRQMVSTILRNLLSNAVKFSRPGGNIQISTSRSADEVIVTVTDEGVGMPKEALKKLFRIDESFSTPGTAKEKGTGLGLILCKEFVDKHGGKIWAASSEHDLEDGTKRGSVFSFSIPNARDE